MFSFSWSLDGWMNLPGTVFNGEGRSFSWGENLLTPFLSFQKILLTRSLSQVQLLAAPVVPVVRSKIAKVKKKITASSFMKNTPKKSRKNHLYHQTDLQMHKHLPTPWKKTLLRENIIFLFKSAKGAGKKEKRNTDRKLRHLVSSTSCHVLNGCPECPQWFSIFF